jgi:hypothetical protein
MKHQPLTAARDPMTGARYLPPVMYFVIAEYELAGPTALFRPELGFACDPLPDLDAAADAVGEAMKDRRDRVVAVLRLTDKLKCDDVTAAALETIRQRLFDNGDSGALERFEAQVEEMADRNRARARKKMDITLQKSANFFINVIAAMGAVIFIIAVRVIFLALENP